MAYDYIKNGNYDHSLYWAIKKINTRGQLDQKLRKVFKTKPRRSLFTEKEPVGQAQTLNSIPRTTKQQLLPKQIKKDFLRGKENTQTRVILFEWGPWVETLIKEKMEW